jgi:hypothetical protein
MKSTFFAFALIGILLTSCSKKNNEAAPAYKIDTENVSVHFDEKHQFTVTQGNVEINAKSITWSSSDQSVATIDENGLLSGKKIGTVTLTASSAGKFSFKSTVTVIPYSTLCQEPYFEDGASITTTKNKEKRSLAGETATSLLFLGENAKVRNTVYIFKDGKMTSAALLFANTDALVQETAKFYKERYTYLGSENNVIFYGDGNALIIAISVEATLGFNAIYFKGNGKTLSLTPQIEQQFNTIKTNTLRQKAIQ